MYSFVETFHRVGHIHAAVCTSSVVLHANLIADMSLNYKFLCGNFKIILCLPHVALYQRHEELSNKRAP